MNAELFYLVGKPNRLKQAFVSQLKEKLTEDASILVPDVYTTDKSEADSGSYVYLDERDFNLRLSMGMYCLCWEKNQHHYGVIADVIQRINTGVDVLLSGSLHNVEQAKKLFPNMNIVQVAKQGCSPQKIVGHHLIAEDDGVRLEWSDNDDMGTPYVLTLSSEKDIPNAIEMLLALIVYEKKYLDDAI